MLHVFHFSVAAQVAAYIMAAASVDHTAEWVVPPSDDGARACDRRSDVEARRARVLQLLGCSHRLPAVHLASFNPRRLTSLPRPLATGWVLSHDALRLDMEDLQSLLDALSGQASCCAQARR